MEKIGDILYRRWRPPLPQAALLLVHGLGAHSGRWRFLADFFFKNGVASYAIELKGFGQTQGLRGHIDSFDIYLNDVRRIFETIREENPGKKVFIAGESMGAVIVFLEAAKGLPSDGLICVSPVFKSALKFKFWDYLRIFFSLLYNPKKQFTVPFNSAMCTRDTVYQKEMDSDPGEHRFATSRLLIEIAASQARCGALKKDIKIPVLFLLAGEDKFTDLSASRKIFNGIKTEDKTIMEYPGLYHALSIELGRERVFDDILEWVMDRI
ncbi:MAG: lysophospholipase [Candidatus Omnitrophica bacterium]|nr:lysophospholipase [Candidatus Omnitrophota bacterium]